MPRLLWILLLACALCGAGEPRRASPFEVARPALKVWGLEEGLPSDTPNVLMLDRRGRLWAGTQEGLATLGWRGWTQLPLPSEAASSYIRSLLEDRAGALWIGTQDDGIWRYDQGVWTHFKPGRDLPHPRINTLLQTRTGDLLAGTWGGGVLRFHDGAWAPLPMPAALRDPFIWKLREATGPQGDNQLWICGQNGLVAQRGQSWQRMDASLGFRSGSVNDVAEVVLPGGARQVWAACWGQGIAAFDGERWTYAGTKEGFPSRNPTGLAVTNAGTARLQVYAATFDAGLACYEGGRWRPVETLRGAGGGTRQITGVYAVLANPGGHPALWFGGRGTGVIALDPGTWRTLDREHGLPSPFAISFLETPARGGGQALWIGTDRGIARWEGGRFALEGMEAGLPSAIVNGLAWVPTPRGPQLWAATLTGLARRDGTRWTQVGLREGLGLTQATCVVAMDGEGGSASLAAGFEGGVALLEGGRWRVMGPKEGLPHPSVFALHYDRVDRSLWVGFRGGGVARWKDGAWLALKSGRPLPNLSVHALTASISPDGRRWIWAGTLGGGLARLDMARPQDGWQAFNTTNLPGLPSLTIHRMEWDAQGRLYLMTARGVARLTLEGPGAVPARVRTFTQGDGLPSTALNFGASLRDHAGRIWVGTSKGIGVLDPATEDEPPPPPPPLVEAVQAGTRVWRPGEAVELDHRARALWVAFDLPVFHRREDVRYRTQLLGLEAEPTDWREEGRREFTGLASGSYRLAIWARDALGRVSGPVEVAFRVRTPPWYRWWAWVSYAVVLGGLVRMAFLVRTRLLQERNLALEKLVQDRTHALEDANLALHAQSMTDPLTGLHNRRALLQAIPDDMLRLFRRFTLENWDTQIIGSHNRDLVFLMVDIDHFKQVNDTCGHHAGDQVLQQMSDILRASVRETDRVVRWGGEEFLVVARDTQAEEVSQLAERIRSGVEQHLFTLEGQPPIRKTCSLGFACFPVLLRDPGLFSWEQVVDLADQCLYQAKHAGRNRWVGILPREDALPDLDLNPQELGVERLEALGLVTRLSSGNGTPG